MSKVVIVINAKLKETGELILASPATEKMLAALKQAIAADPHAPEQVEVVANSLLWSNSHVFSSHEEPLIYYPLTIALPKSFLFPAQPTFQACQQIMERRQWVEEHLHYTIGKEKNWLGDFWLPIVLTSKGPLYGEVIVEGAIPNFYQQPVDLPDHLRQSLYYLAHRLLDSLAATPSVYLLQFGWQEQNIVFDRLWPFPAAPAIASLGVQQPDLFSCYWSCLTNQPILDISILAR